MNLRQFDVFPNPSSRTRRSRPYFVVLQSDQLHQLDTRIVAPLVAPAKILHFEPLMPEVRVRDRPYVILAQELGAFPVQLAARAVANLESERYRIVSALDLLFTGI
ncbi:MAG TPA: CcdB family protein [Rhizomicrobium sp.]|nr:CcdB family protein [Rhizomicrobium sp.]